MNWNAIGAVSEGLGALAVFVTLVYLALQVRDARTEVARTARQNRSHAAREITLTLALDERIGHVLAKANANLGGHSQVVEALMEQTGLAREEVHAMASFYLARWHLQTQVIEDLHALPEGLRIETENFIRVAYADPASRLWYETFKPILNPDAVRHVDALLAQTE
jgi:hypothetical protein